MPLFSQKPIGFIATANPEAARAFYETTLGLDFAYDDGFAMVFHMGPTGDLMLRVVRVRTKDYQPLPFTVYGWESDDIEATVDDLVSRGVAFERYSWFELDERGIWTAPNGEKVAWFKDPDGNLLSVSRHNPR